MQYVLSNYGAFLFVISSIEYMYQLVLKYTSTGYSYPVLQYIYLLCTVYFVYAVHSVYVFFYFLRYSVVLFRTLYFFLALCIIFCIKYFFYILYLVFALLVLRCCLCSKIFYSTMLCTPFQFTYFLHCVLFFLTVYYCHTLCTYLFFTLFSLFELCSLLFSVLFCILYLTLCHF